MKPEHESVAITAEIYNDSSNLRLLPIVQLLLQGKGPLATTGCDHGAFVNTRGAPPLGVCCPSAPSSCRVHSLQVLSLLR
jgi:hypothetical protein